MLLVQEIRALALGHLTAEPGGEDFLLVDFGEGVGGATLEKPFKINSLRATLHFIDPNVEINLPSSMLTEDVCAKTIDEAMTTIALLDGTLDADQFPPLPATHCRICNYRDMCPAGRGWLRAFNNSN